MRSGFLPAIFLGTLLSAAIPVAAQDIDTLVTTTNRSPSTVADQISDPAERDAFLNLYKPQDASRHVAGCERFPSKLTLNPHSWRRHTRLPPTAALTWATMPAV